MQFFGLNLKTGFKSGTKCLTNGNESSKALQLFDDEENAYAQLLQLNKRSLYY